MAIISNLLNATLYKYWPAEEFAGVLLPPSSKHKALAMLVGYFDETGISDGQPAAMVAGVIADSVIWSRIERPWAEQLEIHQKAWYHAVACENGTDHFFGHPRELRTALTQALARILSKVQGQGVAVGVVRADWGSASEDLLKRSQGDPYYVAFETCLQFVNAWSQKFVGGEPVALVFANQKHYEARQTRLHEFYQRAAGSFGIGSIGSLTFADPRLVLQLQAADLVCYEEHRRVAGEDREAYRLLRAGELRIFDQKHVASDLSAFRFKRSLDV